MSEVWQKLIKSSAPPDNLSWPREFHSRFTVISHPDQWLDFGPKFVGRCREGGIVSVDTEQNQRDPSRHKPDVLGVIGNLLGDVVILHCKGDKI